MKNKSRLKGLFPVILLCCIVMMTPARIYAAPSAAMAEGAFSHASALRLSKVPEDAAVSALRLPKLPEDVRIPDIQLPKLPENLSIPEIHFEPGTEKEKLREAIRTMDEMGISPKMLLQRFLDLLDRNKKNRNGAKKTAGTENSSRGGTGELDRITKEIREDAEQQIEKAADQAKKKIGDAAEKEIDQAVDHVKETITQEINSTGDKK